MTKEYILVRERTAPPCVFQTFAHPTSPFSVCSILQLPDCLTEQAQGGAVPSLANIYSVAMTHCSPLLKQNALARDTVPLNTYFCFQSGVSKFLPLHCPGTGGNL